MIFPVMPVSELLSTVSATEVTFARVWRDVFHEGSLWAGAFPAVLAVILVHALVLEAVHTVAL